MRSRPAHRGPAIVLLVLGLLVGAGTATGYGIGRAVDWARDAWPEPRLELVAEKQAPPEAIDPAGVAETCTPSAVRAELSGDRDTLVLGEAVSMTVRVTNEGRMPCLLDAHRSSMQVVVSEADGGERVWSSADCIGAGEELVLLGTDERWELTARWSGSGSTPGCDAQGDVRPGEYTATVLLDDVPGAEGEPWDVTVEAAPEPEPSEDAEDAEGSGQDASTDDGTAAEEDADPSEAGRSGDKASERSGGRSDSGDGKKPGGDAGTEG
ncbi:hypothetical protein [Isoptericola sediminis]|uniref:DUF4232 domain-containing protein n=1 Tax=Isoptericola sediminis TaxID=2733572 RepID=A0A849K091_9MICO|nr:hypothetical protein [Isoptericola sediminis]NNU26518.1 hypothetical protein [Isoptericola sediminis]